MELRGLRYFIGFVVVVGLLVFLVVLIFGGGGGDSKKVPASTRTLSSYAQSDSQVSMTIDGVENSASEHRQIIISADSNHVQYQVKAGYDGNVIESKNFPNSTASYTAFLLALEHANFTKGDVKHQTADPRGYCPLGQRYIFELKDQGTTIERFWATSCGKPKTFLGDLGTNTALFQDQVPHYHDLADNVAL
jgi:hypothetical protein